MQRVLTQSEASEVLSILKGSLDKNFESVTLSFGLLFRRETDKFKACCGLVSALSEVAFLDGRQRLFALYALLELHRERTPDLHPFWEFLLSCGTSPQAPAEEVELVHLFLIQNRGTELLKRNVNEYLYSIRGIPHSVLRSHAVDLLQLQKKRYIKDSGIGAFGQSGLARVLLDVPHERTGAVAREHQAEIFESFAQNLTLSGFEPPFTRPLPPIMDLMDSECQWRESQIEIPLMWNCGSCDPSEQTLQRLKSLLDEAILSPLTLSQQKQMRQDVEEDPKLVFRCDLDPDVLPVLVENAPSAASEILRHLLPSPLGSAYLASLASMTMSLHSMEVVNSLATSISLPADFVQSYISNCITSCNAIEDRHMQSRLVRLVCVFLQSLIRMGLVDMKHLIHEVQAFCIDHSRIREAAGLFRMLKQMENEVEGE